MSQSIHNDLKVTIGVLPIELTLSIDDDGRLQGTQAPKFKFWFENGLRANVTYVETVITGDELGECYANGTCSGYVSQLWQNNQDVELVRQSIESVKFVSVPPLIFSPTGITWATRIISLPQEPSNLIKTSDVIDSFNIQSLVMMLIAFLLFCRLLLKFKNIYRKLDPKSPKNIIWTVFRSFFYQVDFNFEECSFRLITISILFGLFMSKAHYDGCFSTDLTIKEKLVTIDNLADLLNSERWPGYYHGDTSLKAVERSRKEEQRKVAAISKSRLEKHQFTMANLTMSSIMNLTDHIRNREAVLMAPKPAEVYTRLLDCYVQINSEQFADMQLYSSREKYLEEINSFIYNPNISEVLRNRLDKRIAILFEMHFFYKADVIDVFEIAARAMNVEWNLKNSKCVEPDWKDDEHNSVISLRLLNVKKTFKVVTCNFVLAFLTVVIECLHFRNRPVHRRVKRSRKARRVLARPKAKSTIEVHMRLQVRRDLNERF